MPTSCCADGCTNKLIAGSGIGFFTFPRDPELKAKWVKALRRKNFFPTKYTKICSTHFKISDFKLHTNIQILNSNAIPSIFIKAPETLQPDEKCQTDTYCSVPTCSNNLYQSNSEGLNISYYRFPLDKGLAAKWIKNVGNYDLNILTARVCSVHFAEKDLERPVKGKKKLKPDAIPILKLSERTAQERSDNGPGGSQIKRRRGRPRKVNIEIKDGEQTKLEMVSPNSVAMSRPIIEQCDIKCVTSSSNDDIGFAVMELVSDSDDTPNKSPILKHTKINENIEINRNVLKHASCQPKKMVKSSPKAKLKSTLLSSLSLPVISLERLEVRVVDAAESGSLRIKIQEHVPPYKPCPTSEWKRDLDSAKNKESTPLKRRPPSRKRKSQYKSHSISGNSKRNKKVLRLSDSESDVDYSHLSLPSVQSFTDSDCESFPESNMPFPENIAAPFKGSRSSFISKTIEQNGKILRLSDSESDAEDALPSPHSVQSFIDSDIESFPGGNMTFPQNKAAPFKAECSSRKKLSQGTTRSVSKTIEQKGKMLTLSDSESGADSAQQPPPSVQNFTHRDNQSFPESNLPSPEKKAAEFQAGSSPRKKLSKGVKQSVSRTIELKGKILVLSDSETDVDDLQPHVSQKRIVQSKAGCSSRRKVSQDITRPVSRTLKQNENVLILSDSESDIDDPQPPPPSVQRVAENQSCSVSNMHISQKETALSKPGQLDRRKQSQDITPAISETSKTTGNVLKFNNSDSDLNDTLPPPTIKIFSGVGFGRSSTKLNIKRDDLPKFLLNKSFRNDVLKRHASENSQICDVGNKVRQNSNTETTVKLEDQTEIAEDEEVHQVADDNYKDHIFVNSSDKLPNSHSAGLDNDKLQDYDDLMQNYRSAALARDIMLKKYTEAKESQKLIESQFQGKIKELNEAKIEINSLKANINKMRNSLESFLSPSQIKLALHETKTVAWSTEEMLNACTLKHLSKDCYSFLRQKLKYPLPGISSLERWMTIIANENASEDDDGVADEDTSDNECPLILKEEPEEILEISDTLQEINACESPVENKVKIEGSSTNDNSSNNYKKVVSLREVTNWDERTKIRNKFKISVSKQIM